MAGRALRPTIHEVVNAADARRLHTGSSSTEIFGARCPWWLGLLGSVLVSEVSYRYFETPFLKLKARFGSDTSE